jgi:predicted NBD/HSP70 family sugar kinase
MSDQQAPAPTLPNGTALADLSGVQATSALIRAVEICATKAAGDDRAAEVKDYGAAALAFAQAIITLDPTRLAGTGSRRRRTATTTGRSAHEGDPPYTAVPIRCRACARCRADEHAARQDRPRVLARRRDPRRVPHEGREAPQAPDPAAAPEASRALAVRTDSYLPAGGFQSRQRSA